MSVTHGLPFADAGVAAAMATWRQKLGAKCASMAHVSGVAHGWVEISEAHPSLEEKVG